VSLQTSGIHLLQNRPGLHPKSIIHHYLDSKLPNFDPYLLDHFGRTRRGASASKLSDSYRPEPNPVHVCSENHLG
jgi:hypothetical protein